MPRPTAPIEPWPPGLELQMLEAIGRADTPRARAAAAAYADMMAMTIERHIIGSRLPPQARRARWAHIVTLLKLDGERMPEAWRADYRCGARPLAIEIRRCLTAAGVTDPWLNRPKSTPFAALPAASPMPGVDCAPRAPSAAST